MEGIFFPQLLQMDWLSLPESVSSSQTKNWGTQVWVCVCNMAAFVVRRWSWAEQEEIREGKRSFFKPVVNFIFFL